MAFDPDEMTMGEASAFRAGYAAGWKQAKQQALDLMRREHEGIIDLCCEISVGAIKELVEGMETEQ
jgi:hypothetical protein